jgi:hypothetical protein
LGRCLSERRMICTTSENSISARSPFGPVGLLGSKDWRGAAYGRGPPIRAGAASLLDQITGRDHQAALELARIISSLIGSPGMIVACVPGSWLTHSAASRWRMSEHSSVLPALRTPIDAISRARKLSAPRPRRRWSLGDSRWTRMTRGVHRPDAAAVPKRLRWLAIQVSCLTFRAKFLTSNANRLCRPGVAVAKPSRGRSGPPSRSSTSKP